MNFSLINYIALTIAVLLTGYFVVFPVSKKRPVLIKRFGLAIYSSMLVFVPLSFLDFSLYIFVGMTGLLIYILNFWFVYGVNKDNIMGALKRAMLAVRASSEELSTGAYIVNAKTKMSLYCLGGRISVVRFGSTHGSKKVKLMKKVFGKFIQNNFL